MTTCEPESAIDTALIEQAAEILRAGGVVAFPTETVYGLGADARNADAVRRVFAIKGRPTSHPLIVHLAEIDWLEDWARQVPGAARELAEAFWPGPLTLVLPRKPHVLDEVTGGQDSVALRMPGHPVALALIHAAGALVAPSANRFGRVSPTTAEHVRAELGDAVDMVLDGGPCRVGVESTVLSLLTDTPTLLRPGAISPEAIAALLGRPVARQGGGVRAPGTLPAHYAPNTPLELLPSPAVQARAEALLDQGLQLAVLGWGKTTRRLPAGVRRLEMPVQAEDYARRLYAALRELDGAGCDVILVEAPPATSEWLAVQDRLMRAAAAFGRAGRDRP